MVLGTGTSLAPAASVESRRRQVRSTPFTDTRRYIVLQETGWLAGMSHCWHFTI